MAAIEEVGRLLGGRIGGRHSSSMAAARAGLRVEVAELRRLSKEFDVIRASAAALRKEMDLLGASSSKAIGASRAATGGGATSAPSAAGTPKPPSFASGFTSPPITPPPGGSAGPGSPATGGGGALASLRSMLSGAGISGGGAALLGGLAAGRAGAAAMGAVDRRIDRGMNYASDVDRLNVILQQQTGLSQMGVMNTMRKPLANYRLGVDGISNILQFQNQYGTQMGGGMPQMARSIEGIRALSGYTKTTADVLADQTSLQDPRVANRMYNMLGVNAYTMGGGVNDPMKMRQQLTQTLGLTNQTVLRGAKMQGSAVRAMMTDAGIPLEVQDEQLQYAQANMTFKQKGGRGMYDPGNEAHRRIAGVEENFATQQEETERLRASREEAFTRRQVDNMAALERSNQSLIKALGGVEEKLSGLIGARTSGRNWMGIGGRIMQVAGAGLALTGVATGVGIGMMAAGTAMAGDPEEGSSASGGMGSTGFSDSSRDDSISIPVGYSGKRAPLSEVKNRQDFRSLNPRMQDRLLAMFRANPNVGIGGGSRSSKDQEAMFRSRYRKTNKETKIYWDGSYWEHVSGAAAAPPGRSMHEVGLAADLVGDLNWMNANAGRFGLKHFAGVNNEPWHVQPSELPNSRRQYEEGGAQWGSDGGFNPEDSFGSGSTKVTTGAETSEHAGMGNIGGMSLRNFSGMSVADIISVMRADSVASLGGGGRYTAGAKKGRGGAIGDTPVTTGATTTTGGGGALPGVEVARAAAGAGFDKDLVRMVAIAKRESGWNPRAYNGNLATGDQSYGLWQLNTLNSKKGGMMGDLVNSILGQPKGNKNFDSLFDPNTNARVAYEFYRRNGNTTRPWGGYKGMSDTHGADQYMGAAAQAVKDAGLGDPMPIESMAPAGGGRSTTTVSHAPTYQITVAPVIHFTGQPATNDLRKIAQEVGVLLREEVRTLEMRGA